MSPPTHGRPREPEHGLPNMRRGVLAEAREVLRFIWWHPANRGRRLRTTFQAVRFQLRGRLLGKPTITPFGHASKLWAHLHEYSESKAVYANPPDIPEMLVWRQRLKPGDLFVDVGANVGTYTIWAIECGARVIAVEPSADAVERLRRNLALNGMEAEIVQAALGDGVGRALFTRGRGPGNHLVLEADGCSSVEEVRVEMLDDLVGDRRLAGLKIDVEGAEFLVLSGARRALRDRRIALIQLEWNDLSESFFRRERTDVARLLQDFGYRLFRPDESGRLVGVKDATAAAAMFRQPWRSSNTPPDLFAQPTDDAGIP